MHCATYSYANANKFKLTKIIQKQMITKTENVSPLCISKRSAPVVTMLNLTETRGLTKQIEENFRNKTALQLYLLVCSMIKWEAFYASLCCNILSCFEHFHLPLSADLYYNFGYQPQNLVKMDVVLMLYKHFFCGNRHLEIHIVLLITGWFQDKYLGPD